MIHYEFKSGSWVVVFPMPFPFGMWRFSLGFVVSSSLVVPSMWFRLPFETALGCFSRSVRVLVVYSIVLPFLVVFVGGSFSLPLSLAVSVDLSPVSRVSALGFDGFALGLRLHPDQASVSGMLWGLSWGFRLGFNPGGSLHSLG